MKISVPLFILSFILFFNHCTPQNSTAQSMVKKESDLSITKVELVERTRGHHRRVEITPEAENIEINEKKTSAKTEKKSWDTIVNAVEKIDLENISNLEAPSNISSTDRALMSSINISVGEKIYTSKGFDSGNPPQELKELYFLLFSKFDLSDYN